MVAGCRCRLPVAGAGCRLSRNVYYEMFMPCSTDRPSGVDPCRPHLHLSSLPRNICFENHQQNVDSDDDSHDCPQQIVRHAMPCKTLRISLVPCRRCMGPLWYTVYGIYIPVSGQKKANRCWSTLFFRISKARRTPTNPLIRITLY